MSKDFRPSFPKETPQPVMEAHRIAFDHIYNLRDQINTNNTDIEARLSAIESRLTDIESRLTALETP